MHADGNAICVWILALGHNPPSIIPHPSAVLDRGWSRHVKSRNHILIGNHRDDRRGKEGRKAEKSDRIFNHSPPSPQLASWLLFRVRVPLRRRGQKLYGLVVAQWEAREGEPEENRYVFPTAGINLLLSAFRLPPSTPFREIPFHSEIL